MNKIIAMGKTKSNPETDRGVFFKKVGIFYETMNAYRHMFIWSRKTKEEKVGFLCSFDVPKDSISRSNFYKFLTKACGDPSGEVRMAAVNALNREEYIASDDALSLKEILESELTIDTKNLHPDPKNLQLLFDIYNKLENKAQKNALGDLLLKIEKPKIEDLPYLIKQLEIRKVSPAREMAAVLIGKMGKEGSPAVFSLFQAYFSLDSDIFLKTFHSVCPTNQNRKNFIREMQRTPNNQIIRNAVWCYLFKNPEDNPKSQ